MRIIDLTMLVWLGVITLYLLNEPFKLMIDAVL